MATKKTVATKRVAKQNKSVSSNTSSAVVVANQVKLKNNYELMMAEYRTAQAEKERQIGVWADRLKNTSLKMHRLNDEYKKILLKYLKEAYEVYEEVVQHELADDFFASLRGYLYGIGIKTQSNTPDASLLIRYICGTNISTKSVSDYSRVLHGAYLNKISPDLFIQWVEHKTMTQIIEDQRAVENNVETRAERMDRARRVILRLIEARETKPEFSWVTTVVEAEKQISQKGLWIAIGNATRRLGKGPPQEIRTNLPVAEELLNQSPEGFYSDMNLVMMLPLNAEMEKHLLNIYAKTIVDSVEHYEKQINTLEEKVWASELWERLVSAGHEESVKQDEYWSNRQQAARFEDQQEFMDKIVKPKKAKK